MTINATDKLFVPSKRLTRIFQRLLKNRKIKVNGIDMPIDEVITATSNDVKSLQEK